MLLKTLESIYNKEAFVDDTTVFTFNWAESGAPRLDTVEIWEVLLEHSNGVGLYAAWRPYCEFYMVVPSFHNSTNGETATFFYGEFAQEDAVKMILRSGGQIPFFDPVSMTAPNLRAPKPAYL
jgi:hypothetical protein